MATTLQDRIKAVRVYRGLSQEALGELIGVTKSAVSLWESSSEDRAITPTLANIKAICLATGAPVGWLVSDDSEINPAWPV